MASKKRPQTRLKEVDHGEPREPVKKKPEFRQMDPATKLPKRTQKKREPIGKGTPNPDLH